MDLESKVVRVSINSLHDEMSYLRGEMRLRDETMMQIVRLGDEKSEQAVRNLPDKLSDKLDFAIDIRERLASLEARTPRQ